VWPRRRRAALRCMPRPSTSKDLTITAPFMVQ
jgi:hypothetical protein